MISMREDFLTVEDVAIFLKMSEETVKRLLRKGQLPGYKIGGQWRIEREELIAFLAKQRNQNSNQ